METQTNSKLSAIDRALAAAKARKAAREATEGDNNDVTVGHKSIVLTSEVREKSIERSAARAQINADKESKATAQKEAKAAAKAEKAAKKAAKLAAAEEGKKVTHLKKVERARERLPKLDAKSELAFNELTGSLSAFQLHVLSQHLQLHNRTMVTLRSTAGKPHAVGATVRIVGGEPKFIGMIGKVVHSHKLRAKVDVPGQKKLVYIYSADAEPYEESASAAG